MIIYDNWKYEVWIWSTVVCISLRDFNILVIPRKWLEVNFQWPTHFGQPISIVNPWATLISALRYFSNNSPKCDESQNPENAIFGRPGSRIKFCTSNESIFAQIWNLHLFFDLHTTQLQISSINLQILEAFICQFLKYSQFPRKRS